jgi:hypothetical protein
MDETKRKKNLARLAIWAAIAVLFYFTLGFYVTQPIGAIPDGATLVYVRAGTKLPFIASADGLLASNDMDVSLMGRGIMMAMVGKVVKDRRLFVMPYVHGLYLISTGGSTYDR